MESEIIQNPFYHYSYVFDKNTGNLEYPDIYLLTKSLHKKGQLYPVTNLKIVVKANDTDEVSFDYYKYLDDIEQELYKQLKTDSVVYIKGFGCFQLKVNEYDKEDGVCKSVSGESLANIELANILATLEVNNENDILVSDYENESVADYIPTVFYRDPEMYNEFNWSSSDSRLTDDKKKQKLKDSSLLHRIFSYAPHYEIGHVDKSLYYVQKTFSWNNSTIFDVLKEIGEEVGCIFTFETYLDDNGETVRRVNAYDISYCKKCYENESMQLSYKTFDTSKFRSITNGICDNCNSSEYVYDYGKDTDIFVTTENLTDSISIQPDNEIKNVFKVSGGDDVITTAVQALNMGSSKLIMFSDDTKEEMSDELCKKFDDYITDQSSMSSTYQTLVETQSNVYDLIQYLQSGKMPQLADNTRDIQEEVEYLLESITNDYENNFYVESYDKGEKSYIDHKYTVSESSIRNLFTLYLDKGYSIKVTNGDIGNKVNSSDNYVRWEGVIKVYETSNSDNYAEIHCYKSESTYVEYNLIIGSSSDTKLQETYSSFFVNLMFADEDKEIYAKYIQQFCKQKLASYKKVEYKNEEEKPWKEYSYERLKSFRDGYQACLESLTEMESQQTIESIKKVISDMYNTYSTIRYNISEQMKILERQINALYRYLGEYTYETDKYGKRTYSPDYVSEDYVVDYKSEIYSMAYSSSGTKYFIGTKPISCKKCGSSNVGVAKTDSGREYRCCFSCGNTDAALLTTYADIAKQVSDQCQSSSKNLTKEIFEIRNKFKIENYFGDLYYELLPYIKEQEYNNSNYTSDACNTNQEVYSKAKELLQKAKKELYKACRQQVTVSSDMFSIVAERWKNWDINTKYHDVYDKFTLGNWMRVRLDKTVHKLRLISITFDFDNINKLSVEFSNVIQVGDVLSDLNSMLQQTSSISSTYNYVTDQANQGSEANTLINKILENGYNSALSAVMAGDNQEITMDRHGLLFRKFLDETNDYSKYQMKLINRNIVMTDDAWETATLAIGLGMLPDGTYGYGIWADNIVGGSITCTKNLRIVGGKSSVIIDGNGIRFGNGVIDSSAVDGLDDLSDNLNDQEEQLALYEKEISEFKKNVEECLGTTTITKTAIISPKICGGYLYIVNSNGCSVEIDPLGLNNGNVFRIAKNSKEIMTVDSSGDGTFNGKITATTGNIAGWEIRSTMLRTTSNASIFQYNKDADRDNAMQISSGKASFGKYDSSNGLYYDRGYADISADGIYCSANGNNIYDAYYLFAVDTDKKTITVGRNLYMYEDYYIMDINDSDSTIIGKSSGKNIWVGHCSSSGQSKTTSIILNSTKTEVKGTLFTPDGKISVSDKRFKTDIHELDNSSIEFILNLVPSKYKLKDGTSGRYHYGFIAQPVKELMDKTIGDVGLIVKSESTNTDDPNYIPVDFDNEDTFKYGLRYEEFIAPIVKTIQYQQDKIKNQEEKICKLEERIDKLEEIISQLTMVV